MMKSSECLKRLSISGSRILKSALLISARNDADQILGALRKQLGEFGRLIDAGERARMDEVAERLEAARTGADRELIAKLVEELNEVTTRSRNG